MHIYCIIINTFLGIFVLNRLVYVMCLITFQVIYPDKS